MTRNVSCAMLILCFILCGCNQAPEANADKDRMTATIAIARREPITDRIELIGTVKPEPDHSARITAVIQGLLSAVGPKVGDSVARGEVVARLQDAFQLAQCKQTKGALVLAEANLRKTKAGSRPQEVEQAHAAVEAAKANLLNATANRVRIEKLFAEQVSPGKDLDLAVDQEKVAAAQLRTAEAALSMALKGPRSEDKDAAAGQAEQAAGAFQQAKVMVDFATLRSPISGIVAERYLDPGEQATPSTPVMLVVDPKIVMVQATVPVGFSKDIRVGQDVDVLVPDGSATMHGAVARIGVKLDPLTSTLPVQIIVRNPELRLKFDMPVKATILKERRTALTIPSSAIIGDPDNPHRRYVNVLNGDCSNALEVTVGAMDGDRSEILSGLAAGQKVICDVGYKLPDGTKVAAK